MLKRLLFNSKNLNVTVKRLCNQLIENHNYFEKSVIIGLQPRGIFFAQRIINEIEKQISKKIKKGYLDTTFYRDDYRNNKKELDAKETMIPFSLDEKNVIIVDDVLFTGRTVRSAMEGIINFGRPNRIELLVLIDRKFSREIPIQATYIGKSVNTVESQKILVNLKEQGHKNDKIWLIKN
tara:strand:+ start:7683 stop:8222 length:540 start_codon:yes stop_codon:yes gene_type:complete